MLSDSDLCFSHYTYRFVVTTDKDGRVRVSMLPATPLKVCVCVHSTTKCLLVLFNACKLHVSPTQLFPDCDVHSKSPHKKTNTHSYNTQGAYEIQTYCFGHKSYVSTSASVQIGHSQEGALLATGEWSAVLER